MLSLLATLRRLNSRRPLTGLLASATLALTACGGGGGPVAAVDPAAVQTDTSRSARAAIGSAGGQLSVTAADGRRYTLTVPPGALSAATEISVTPVESMGAAPLAAGLKGAVRFAPAGLTFAQPASLRVEGATPLRPGLRAVGFSRSDDGQVMRLILRKASSGAFEIAVFHFSDVGVAEATAADIASVPPASPASVVSERILELLARSAIETDAQAQAALGLIFDQMVKPALDAASAADDVALREQALLAYEGWLRAFVLIDVAPDAATLNATLAGDLTSARPQAAVLLKRQLASFIAQCVNDPQNLGFELAMAERKRAADLGLATTGFGLAPSDTLRQVNDCVRLVIQAGAFPETVTVGTPRSLDARASLIFASAAQNLQGTPAEFTVTSSDATVAAATGFSDAAGGYTVVVTPRVDKPVFALKACYVLDVLFRGGGITDLCTNVTAPERVAAPTVVLAGRATRTFDFVNLETGSTVSVQGTVDFRVRAEADGKFTVLEAVGTLTDVRSGDAQCRRDGIALSTQRLTERAVHSITQGGHFGSGLSGGFGFTGPTTRTVETIVGSNTNCNVITVTNTEADSADFGSVLILGIERDANGQPTLITLGGSAGIDGEITGSLRRE
jgi:hypothetical protein